VIGDSCVDRFVYGYCNRLSPEAPVPVLSHKETKEMPGMAGNVVQNIKAFTNNITFLTQKAESVKTRYVDARSNQHIMRFDSGLNSIKNLDYLDISSSKINAALKGGYNVVIISDYNKGFLKQKQMLDFTKTINQIVYVDSKKSDVSCFKNSIIKLNQKEYEAAGATVDETSTVIKTMGQRGAAYNGSIYPVQSVEVFDVSGAGDTFVASFSIFHSVTDDIIGSIKFANKCASLVVQKKGTYALRCGDLHV